MEIQEQLLTGGQKLGLSLSGDQLQAIERLLACLDEYNQHTNLVSKSDAQTVVADHVIDAFSLMPLVAKVAPQPEKLIDIGSGAGFPGLILSILLPQCRVHLVESVAKKTRFLSEVTEALGLSKRVIVHTARAEQLAHDKELRESFNIATARAVGSLNLVAELCLPFLAKGGYLLAQKSRRQASDELKAALSAIDLLGGKQSEIIALPSTSSERDLVVVAIEKSKTTPAKFPRASSQLKRPLS